MPARRTVDPAKTRAAVLAVVEGEADLSGGQRRRLQLLLILLDEPTIGLAPMIVETIFEAVERINREGVSFLIVEQNAAKALERSHRGYVLEMGENRYHGASRDLRENESVRNMYLGGT